MDSTNAQRMVKMLGGLTSLLSDEVSSVEIRNDHDVHGFYRSIKDSSRFLHVQGYPGLSDHSVAKLRLRVMDYDKMMLARKMCLPGNEHDAVILLCGLKPAIFDVRYDADELRSMIRPCAAGFY